MLGGPGSKRWGDPPHLSLLGMLLHLFPLLGRFWGAELSLSPLQLSQGDHLTTISHVPDGKCCAAGSVLASMAAQAEQRENRLCMLQGCPKQRKPRAERLRWVLGPSHALPRAEITRKRNCMLQNRWSAWAEHTGEQCGLRQALSSETPGTRVSSSGAETHRFSDLRLFTIHLPWKAYNF